MKYVNADHIFPEALLKEIQKYVHGEMVYVPKPKGLRKKWGEDSGIRNDLNHNYRSRYDSVYDSWADATFPG